VAAVSAGSVVLLNVAASLTLCFAAYLVYPALATGLIGGVGAVFAAGLGGLAWLIERMNQKSGERRNQGRCAAEESLQAVYPSLRVRRERRRRRQ
jgi:hypothetical protein